MNIKYGKRVTHKNYAKKVSNIYISDNHKDQRYHPPGTPDVHYRSLLRLQRESFSLVRIVRVYYSSILILEANA